MMLTNNYDQVTPTDSATFNGGNGTCGNCGRSCGCSTANVTVGAYFVPGNSAASNVGPVKAAPTNRAERRAEAARDRADRRRARQRRQRRARKNARA